MQRLTLASVGVLLSLLSSVAQTRTNQDWVVLAWDPNSEPDLGGYIVYYGVKSRVYTNAINVGNVTTQRVDGLVCGGVTYYFAVTAYNTNGLESDYSDEVSYTTLPCDFTLPKLLVVRLSSNYVSLRITNDYNWSGVVLWRTTNTSTFNLTNWTPPLITIPVQLSNVYVFSARLTNLDARSIWSAPELKVSTFPPKKPMQLRFLFRLLTSMNLNSNWIEYALISVPITATNQQFWTVQMSIEPDL